MAPSNAEKIRVTITLEKTVYEKIKKQARNSGLKPSGWISMIVTSAINNVIKIEWNSKEEG